MPSKTVTVGSSVGLHARPATIIAEVAGQFDDEITLSLPSNVDAGVDAGSSLLIMTLGAQQGAEVVVSSDDPEAVDTIAGLVEQDLDAQ